MPLSFLSRKSTLVPLSILSPLIAEKLHQGGEVSFTITGNSMWPLLHHRRDKVCLIRAPQHALKKHDIPLYVRSGETESYILHRIVAVSKEGYTLRGDNQYAEEFPVLPSQVVGLVKGFWRNGRYISCDNGYYRLYCRLWELFFPARLALRGVLRYVHRQR